MNVTFWQLLIVVLAGAAVMAAILGAFVAYAMRKERRANEQFLRSMHERNTLETRA